jgi:hypothetical protein
MTERMGDHYKYVVVIKKNASILGKNSVGRDKSGNFCAVE